MRINEDLDPQHCFKSDHHTEPYGFAFILLTWIRIRSEIKSSVVCCGSASLWCWSGCGIFFGANPATDSDQTFQLITIMRIRIQIFTWCWSGSRIPKCCGSMLIRIHNTYCKIPQSQLKCASDQQTLSKIFISTYQGALKRSSCSGRGLG
jgi:hypothetical protein